MPTSSFLIEGIICRQISREGEASRGRRIEPHGPAHGDNVVGRSCRRTTQTRGATREHGAGPAAAAAGQEGEEQEGQEK